METIRIIVKGVVVIIIFAAFLDILLPRSDMKRYVNLIIGLFVIIAVLNPFLTVLNKGIPFDILSNERPTMVEDTQTLIQKGKSLAGAQRSGVAKDYKDKLSRQIAAMAGLYQKIEVGGVDIDMVDDSASPDFGKIRKVILHLNNPRDAVINNQDKPAGEVNIEEIQIGSKASKTAEPGPKKGQGDFSGLREMIANFYGLSADQVIIEN